MVGSCPWRTARGAAGRVWRAVPRRRRRCVVLRVVGGAQLARSLARERAARARLQARDCGQVLLRRRREDSAEPLASDPHHLPRRWHRATRKLRGRVCCAQPGCSGRDAAGRSKQSCYADPPCARGTHVTTGKAHCKIAATLPPSTAPPAPALAPPNPVTTATSRAASHASASPPASSAGSSAQRGGRSCRSRRGGRRR